ncbi:carboxylating nicotinate-nucleotide diphosphorylase [Clostridium sp. 19966]|uniref:carboxylating nicotinate-nucleotide diphosphorylase n=1 Tax=Clostridium sp. 19966 TaxID=2768166 RepID=UPI0028DE1FFA|nr:carboxylating nicotinate-nucleotide diphosphorylase [Clostridium sp. 19966]MDT8716765.1 carboxylating nicotinate-nucleotide diphosphorylase [Clostridium sp. 19966]
MNYSAIDKIILNALEEDAPLGDITTSAIVSKSSRASVNLIAKEDGIAAGLTVFKRVFDLLGEVKVNLLKEDGSKVSKGEIVAILEGNTHNLLLGERTALNLLQRMSGIATLTYKFTEKLQGTKTKLLDTRKTTPGLRILEKYSVKLGGGCNHRFGLSDGFLLKDNHIDAAGGVKNAIEAVRAYGCYGKMIEVEVETIAMVKEALEAKADIIMLDNMELDKIKEALILIAGRAITEVSGNVNLETIGTLAATGVDYISVGELTHSAKILDFSLKNLTPIC